jgi:hypothetical protein
VRDSAEIAATDAAACREVARRAASGTLAQVVVDGEPTDAPHEPGEDWEYFGDASERKLLRIAGNNYVLGTSVDPIYVSRVEADGVESAICEFADGRVLTQIEALQARSARENVSLSLEALKLPGLKGARALLEASDRTDHPLPLANDSDGNVLGDAIGAHRDDVLSFYLNRGVDPNLKWSQHTLVDGVHSTPTHDAPLFTAVRYGTPESLRLLLEHHADPNAGGGDSFHDTALSWAVSQGVVSVTRALLGAGANPNLPPGSYAVMRTVDEILRDGPAADNQLTAIHMALAHGADPKPWIFDAFQKAARQKARDDLLGRALEAPGSDVKTEWIRDLLSSPGSLDPRIEALLKDAAMFRDSAVRQLAAGQLREGMHATAPAH